MDITNENQGTQELILPILMTGINLLTDEEFYKTLGERIIVTLSKNTELYERWVKQDMPMHIMGMEASKEDEKPAVHVGDICPQDSIPDELKVGRKIQDCTFAVNKPYSPDTITLPILSLVINNQIRNDRMKVIAEIIRSIILTFEHMAKPQLVQWKLNGFRVEVFFADELLGGENLFMTMQDQDVPGGVVLLAHWVTV